MLSLWTILADRDIDTYLATQILPDYLSHLQLRPFRFDFQEANRDGRESLRVIYAGEGRLEEYALTPEEHALRMIRFVCPEIHNSRIHLPRNDARWYWTAIEGSDEPLRVFFGPSTQSLGGTTESADPRDSYVSVSRGHIYIDPASVEAYLKAWFDWLGIDSTDLNIDLTASSGDVEFTTPVIGGQLCLADSVTANDLVRFAGLENTLRNLDTFVELNLAASSEEKCGVCADGIYLNLIQRETQLPGEAY